MKKMNRLFVNSFVFAGALTLAAVVGTGSAEASEHHGDRAESHGMVQAKDEFYGNKHHKPVTKERHERPEYKPARPAKTERHDSYVKHENHARPEKAEQKRDCGKAEKVKQHVKIVKPVKSEKPVKAEKPVKTEKPVKDKSHSQGAEHASETAKLHANPNSAIFAGDTEKEAPVVDEPVEVVVETPAVEDEKDAVEVETPDATDTEEGKTEDAVTDDQDDEDAAHHEDTDKEESKKGEKVREVIVLLNKIRTLLLENNTENDKLYEAINAAILAFEESLKEDTADVDAPAVPKNEDDDEDEEVEVVVSDSTL